VRGEHLTRSLLRAERLDVSSVKHSLVGQCVFAACFGAAHFACDAPLGNRTTGQPPFPASARVGRYRVVAALIDASGAQFKCSGWHLEVRWAVSEARRPGPRPQQPKPLAGVVGFIFGSGS
jgi:hypothetical protein